jgi:RNA polymerase sigma-70 factor (ECF subfamily)
LVSFSLHCDRLCPEELTVPLSSPFERALPVSLLWPKEKRTQLVVVPPPEAPAPPSDESLMLALKAADREALAELFRRYSRLVFSIGVRVLRDAGEAEEIVQDVFLYLYEKANLFDATKGMAKAWIVQIAHHRSLDRKGYLYRRQFYVGTDVAALADTLAGRDDLDRDLASKLNRDRLREAFERLSERQRATLELFFFEGLELKEIAERIGETYENVRHNYYRGLQKLRKDAFVQKLRDKH